MFDPFTPLAVALGVRSLLRAIPHPRPLPRRVEAVPTTTPIHVDHPLFSRQRGAVLTTQELNMRRFAADPGPLYALAGVMWSARRSLNKLTVITGRPDSGKTVLMRMMIESVAALFPILESQALAGLYPGKGRMRWLMVDPTNAYLPLLYQVVPEDVPIIRATPVDAEGARWDIAADITSDALNLALQDALFPDTLAQKANDPFWYAKSREVTQAIVTLYLDRGSPWEFADMTIPIRFPQLLKPLLQQGARTRGLANHDLVGKLGRDIVSTASSVLNKMAIAAALWQNAKKRFSLRDFLDGRSVLHFAYTPDMIPCFAGIANALVRVLVLLGITRNDPFDHTIMWLDEGRYLSDLAGLEDLAARGRGAGFGAIFAAQGFPGLIAKWGEGRVKELRDLISTWVALSSGPETAQAFSEHVGKIEGMLKGYGHSSTYGTSETSGTSYSSSWQGLNNSSTYGRTSSTTTNSSSTHSENFSLTLRDAILPSELTNLPYAHDGLVHGFAFNPDMGAFRFQAPFLQHFANLPVPLVESMPLRPASQQRLEPWRIEDVTRLKLEPTPELIIAIEKTWEGFGGTN